jgi:hypothetical protein
MGLSLAGLFDELAWSDVVSLISAWKVQIGLAVFAVAISPSLFLFVFAVVIGVFLGLYLSPLARHGGSSSRGTGELKVIWKDDGRKATIPRRKRDQIALPDVVSSALLGQLDTLISYFLRDFIRAWWNPMGNMAKPPDFVDSLRRTLESAAATGISQAKTTAPASLMIPLVHAITQHLRLYRTFESSGLPFSAYIAKNPSSPLSRFSSDALIESHLHTLSQLILSRTVPDDESGPTGIALARSSLSLFILLQTLLALSDPDFWNQRIVEALGGVPYGMAGVEVVSKPDVKARKIPPLATVWVRLIEAGRLSIPGAVGTVYATVRVGVEELRTGRVPGESNPVFDWEGWFEFEAGGGEGNIDGIIVDVWGRGGLQGVFLWPLSDQIRRLTYIHLPPLARPSLASLAQTHSLDPSSFLLFRTTQTPSIKGTIHYPSRTSLRPPPQSHPPNSILNSSEPTPTLRSKATKAILDAARHRLRSSSS